MTKPTITNGWGYGTDCHTIYGSTTGTADSGDTTHTVDIERTEIDDYWNGFQIYFTSGPNVGLSRLITDFDDGTDTITHGAFPNAVAAGHTYKISEWKETEDGNTGDFGTYNDDYFDISISGSGGNKIYYISCPYKNLNLLSITYTTILFRYKTYSGNTQAKIIIVFDDASTQTVLDETLTTVFKAGSATITSGKTIDHIRLYANQATGGVFYDFVLICKTPFTFPNTQYGTEFNPPPRYAMIPIPSRIVDITQNLGSESATFTASCNLDIGRLSTTLASCTGDDWKRPQGLDALYQTDKIKGEVFLDIAHNSYAEPFQWLDTGKQQFKVTLDTLRFPEHSDSHTVDLTFKEYSRSSKSNESYVERFGLNL